MNAAVAELPEWSTKTKAAASPPPHLGEALDVQAQVVGEARDPEAPAPQTDVIMRRLTVKLAHDVEDGDLRRAVLRDAHAVGVTK
jgi:hypothetical protein